MSRRPSFTITVDPAAVEILERVGPRKRAEYISQMVQLRERQWRYALQCLRAHDWTGSELLAVCDVMNGTFVDGAGLAATGSGIALEMQDAQSITKVAEKWGVAPKRWAELIKTLGSSDEDPAARGMALWLVTVVQEVWAGNAAVEAQLRK